MAITYEASLVSVTPQPAGQPTFTEVCALTWTALTLLDELGAPGSCTLTGQVDKIEPVGKARLLNLALTPCELWVRRTVQVNGGIPTSSIVFAGQVTGWRISNRSITLVAPGLLAYLQYWLADVNVLTTLNGSAATEYAFSSIDQAVIVQRLADAWQAQAYGHDGIVTTGLTATGVTRDLTLSARDGKYIMPVITEMGVRNNGFDLTVDPSTRRLTMWSPRKGTDRTGTVFLDRRSIGVPDLSCTVAPGAIGSEVFASSNSTQGATLTSIATNATLRATFGRSYVSKSYQDISLQATLDDYASRQAVDMGTLMFTAAPELLPVTGFSYSDFDTGDLITYDFDAGLGQQTFTVRIASKQTSMDSGREILKVGIL